MSDALARYRMAERKDRDALEGYKSTEASEMGAGAGAGALERYIDQRIADALKRYGVMSPEGG